MCIPGPQWLKIQQRNSGCEHSAALWTILCTHCQTSLECHESPFENCNFLNMWSEKKLVRHIILWRNLGCCKSTVSETCIIILLPVCTAQGGGGSFKDLETYRRLVAVNDGIAERMNRWTDKQLEAGQWSCNCSWNVVVVVVAMVVVVVVVLGWPGGGAYSQCTWVTSSRTYMCSKLSLQGR